ncbi:glycosyltransferase [Paraoerskovia marina]|uniref:glycosyltransferase n=1 Tax=Paraoerskovia marina TaxID=545619 RepID=UPI0009F2034C
MGGSERQARPARAAVPHGARRDRRAVTGRLRSLSLALSFAARTVLDDPAWLMLNAVQRAPSRLRPVLGRPARWLERRVSQEKDPAGAASLRAAWARGDASAVVDAVATSRAAARVQARVTEQVELLRARSAPAHPRSSASAPREPLRVHHHLTNSLPHTLSGYTQRSHSVLTAQRRAGIELSVSTRLGYPATIGVPLAPGSDTVDAIRYERLVPWTFQPDHRKRLASEVDLLCARITAAGSQIVQTTTPWTTGEAGRLAAARLGLPWVHEVRGLPEETWAASHETVERRDAAMQSTRYRLIRDKETELAATADAVITLSATMRGELISRGVDADRIAVIANSVDVDTLAGLPDPSGARSSLGLPPDRPLVGSVGSLVGYEGLDTTLRAVAMLRSRGLDVGALIVGDGVARPDLLRLVSSLGLQGVAHLPGRVNRATAARYVAALDVVAVPRRADRVTRLVTPLKPVEAMAVGRPVVVSDLPALREVTTTTEGPNAALVASAGDPREWADRLEEILRDPVLRDRLVSAGHLIANDRTWVRAAGTYRKVYDNCLVSARSL